MERSKAVTMGGNPMTLVGKELRVGDKAPDFTLLNKEMKPVRLSESKGKVRLLSVVTALDTSVCNIQTNTFNKRLADLGDQVKSYTISVDLPATQKRFENEHGLSNVEMLSDYRETSFGQAYGLLIKELRLLSRAVIVVDQNDTVRHFEIVPEVGTEPNYDKALEAIEKAIG